jgi:glycine hydroxymethyltransferase
MAAYFAFLTPGDTVLGMDLAHGGHLSHGSPASFSGRLFNFVSYGVNQETGTIDYGEVRALAERWRPRMIIAGANACVMIIDFGVLSHLDEQGILGRIRETVQDLCNAFPVYQRNHIQNASLHQPLYSYGY